MATHLEHRTELPLPQLTTPSEMTSGPRSTLVADLRRPEAYPGPRPSSVGLRDTHASWVFLTAAEAWKIKKPVNYGFLDFSDETKRRRCCEEELRLGARLAPDVYLGVEPVYLGPGGHSFVRPGKVVDHALRMRRLPDEESAAALLSRGELGPQHLRSLATRLADFYASASRVPDFSAPAVLSANIAENLEQTQPYLDRYVGAHTLTALHRWQEGAIFALGALLGRRQAAGRIREGHGDLRLEHVYYPGLPDDGPIVIDPIEFNRRFRCLDQALDVAFLAMELDAAKRSDLAATFLSEFARASNDYELYPVIDLYLSYRAWVRAKIACMVAADPATPPHKATRKAAEAAGLFELAVAYTRPRPGPRHVIAIGGLIGTGKSTLAGALTRRLMLPAISSDATRKGLAGLRPTDHGPPWLYSAASTGSTYAEMCRRAGSVLDSGRGVILDGTFGKPELRRGARDLASAHDRPFLLVELACDEKALRSRLESREGHPHESDARIEQLPAMREAYETTDELAAHERLVLDGARPIEELVEAVRAHVESQVGPRA